MDDDDYDRNYDGPLYVVCDIFGDYVRNRDGTSRTPASNEAFEFNTREEAEDACTRATDRVLERDPEDRVF